MGEKRRAEAVGLQHERGESAPSAKIFIWRARRVEAENNLLFSEQTLMT